MSGGSPTVGGGYMRQRYSQGYASSGDDLEDDACSRPFGQSPSYLRTRTWIEVVENCLWIASALFIIYYGDQDSNFVYLLWHDGRIRRIPLYMGMFAVGLNAIVFFYTIMLAWGIRKSSETWETSSTTTLPVVTVIGLISFCLFSFALWPIWSFFTLPLVVYMPWILVLQICIEHWENGFFGPWVIPQFTLFMACMVIFPYLVLERLKSQEDDFRID